MHTPRLSPAEGVETVRECEEKRSRFIGQIARANSEDEAREFISTIRSTHPDARHNCSAFVVRVPGALDVERSSDDGEPAGTAGRPMLEVLRGSGVTNVVAVVTRYFGGVLLGTGGLVKAYTEATALALAATPLVEIRELSVVEVDAPHADAGRLHSDLHAHGVEVDGTEYGPRHATLTVCTDRPDEVVNLVAQVTSGGAEARVVGLREVERRVQR